MIYKNLDKALLFLRNEVFCLKIWKLWWAPATLRFIIFCWNFAHVFYLPMSSVGGIFFILFRSWVICKKLKTPGFYTLFSTFLLITQDLDKIKKIPNCLLETLLSRKRVQNFSKKY